MATFDAWNAVHALIHDHTAPDPEVSIRVRRFMYDLRSPERDPHLTAFEAAFDELERALADNVPVRERESLRADTLAAFEALRVAHGVS